MKTISVFGATGSIGSTTISLLKQAPNDFDVSVLTGGCNVVLLAKLAKEVNAEHVVISDETLLDTLREALNGTNITSGAGRSALLEAASRPVDISVQGIVGYAGVETSLEAAKTCTLLALANKESLVCAGSILLETCKKHGTTLLPVDSEHSAIFQCLNGEARADIARLIITASGGPFRNYEVSQLATVTPEMAAKHPNWSMGKRISIDSASMFNKAMEMIEARELFNAHPDQIEVIIQPQSIIHSMVGFTDGAIMAHLGPPDMAGAIGYALHYPDRANVGLKPLNFAEVGRLDFEEVDNIKFPAVNLARTAMELGGMAGAVFNAAKEQALDLFLTQRLGFMEMADAVEFALEDYSVSQVTQASSIDDLNKTDSNTRSLIVKRFAKDKAC